MKLAFAMAGLVLAACHTGDLDETCNRDGTCNSPGLECSIDRCTPRPKAPVPGGCLYESDCFCASCAEHCGEAGAKRCEYSDTTVWGAKPALCECK